MAWIRFTDRFNYKPNAGTTIAYKAGMVLSVPAACATLAVLAGKAVRLKTPRKGEPAAGDTRWLTGDEAIAAAREWDAQRSGEATDGTEAET